MHQIKLMYKKEAKDFALNKNIWIRYVILLAYNIIVYFAYVPGLNLITTNKPTESFYLSVITTFMVVAVLCMEVIGKEKSRKTYETLLSTPLKLGNMFLGKMAFVFTIGLVFLLLATVFNNLWLYFLLQQSYLKIDDSRVELLILYALVLAGILLITVMGMLVSLLVTNYRMMRMVLIVVGIAGVVGISRLMQHYTLQLGLAVLLGTLGIIVLIFLIIQKHMNKKFALKYAK